MPLVFDANRARAAGLVQLPRSIQGASCNNCQFFRYEPQVRDRSIGYCSHFRMMMNVLSDWHCDMWKRPDAPLASPPGIPGSRSGLGLGRRFARSLIQRYSRAARGPGFSDALTEVDIDQRASGGSRAASGLRARSSSSGVLHQRADGDLRVVDLALPDRPNRRFAKAGDADDCGHQRHGGLFTPKNTCAAGGSGRREGTSAPALSPLGDESDRRLIDVTKRLIEAKAAADAAAQEPRKSSLPPPTVMSPEPFEPDEPIRWRIANLPGAREMMAKIVNEVPHYRDRLKKSEEELAKYNVSLTANLRRNENAMYAGTLSEEDYRVQTQLQAGIDRLKDEIDSIREKVSMIVDAAIDARGKNVKLRSLDGVTPFANAWDERDIGRRRSEAYSWFQNKLSGSGAIRVRWNAFLGTGRAGATVSGSMPSIDVDYDSSGTRTYIHEIGHVLDQSVDGIGKAAVEFLRYRTMHTPDRPMNEIYPHENPEDNEYEDNEIGNEDHFGKLHRRAGYIGKKYPGDENITEIVSMGLQFLYDDPVHFIETDPEYATFILGILDGRLRSP